MSFDIVKPKSVSVFFKTFCYFFKYYFSINSRKGVRLCYQFLHEKLSMIYFFEGTFEEKLTVLVMLELKYLTLWNMGNLHLGLIPKVPTLIWGEAISLTQWKSGSFNQIIPLSLFLFLFFFFYILPPTLNLPSWKECAARRLLTGERESNREKQKNKVWKKRPEN